MSSSGNRSKYFAAEDDAEVVVAYLQDKAENWFSSFTTNSYIEKLRKSWLSYHGNYYRDAHTVSFGGENGELVNLAVNHYRNIADHIINMTTSTRPAFQAKSTNTDYKSQTQTILATGLLEYYMREKRLETLLKKAVQLAVVMGAGYIKMEWNATSGKIHDYIEPAEDEISDFDEDGKPLDENGDILEAYPIYEGDVEFKALSPFDVVYDSTKESASDNDWVLVRTFKNKYDLAAKFPEMADEIKAKKTKDELQKSRTYISALDETVDVPVYEFFHNKTESMPEGRYVLYLDSDCVLMDTVMPYRRLPIYRIAPSEILGTPYGYTSMFDLIPLQDSLNSLYSTILTNQNAFGVQNILNPRGNDVRVNQVNGGLNFIEYNKQVGAPEALNLTQTPAEIFNFTSILEKSMETISGVNSVTRGDPAASLKSGSALALVQSQSLQFNNGLQQSYIYMIEDVGTGLIELLQDFAAVPRVAEIVGITNKSKMQEFTGDDINSISRVMVDVGNSLAQTAAGRAEMADNLIQMGLIKVPEDYFSVISTGKLTTMTEGSTNHNMLIRSENETLSDGTSDVIATAIDPHSQHIREHMNVLADPDLRQDPVLVERVLAHIAQHIELLQTTDPNILAIIGEQALGPAAGSPVSTENAAPPEAGAGNVSGQMEAPQPVENSAGLPNQPNMPIDPATGQPFPAGGQGV